MTALWFQASDIPLQLSRQWWSHTMTVEEEEGKEEIRINYDKSQVVWLGSQKGSATVFLPHLKLKWNPTRFSVLGIIYSTDLEKIMDLSYNPKIEQIQIPHTQDNKEPPPMQWYDRKPPSQIRREPTKEKQNCVHRQK